MQVYIQQEGRGERTQPSLYIVVTSSTQGGTLEYFFLVDFWNQVAQRDQLLLLSTFLPTPASNSHQERSNGRKIAQMLNSSGPYIAEYGFKLTRWGTPEKPGKRQREKERRKKVQHPANPNNLTTQEIAMTREENQQK